MSVITVCKNVIGQNNKAGWKNPKPPVRIANTCGGEYTDHVFEVSIKDKNGEEVAKVITTKDGKPVVKCGAKVAIITKYPV